MDLRAETIAAFSKVPRPAEDALTDCDCDESQFEVAGFWGKTWFRLGLDDFHGEVGDANEAFLTPAAFHYFLPGLILLAIDHPECREHLLASIVRCLVPLEHEGEAGRDRVAPYFNRLSPRQKRVIGELLAGSAIATHFLYPHNNCTQKPSLRKISVPPRLRP